MLIVTANQKGGVGKSTIAVHLATWLFDRGYRVALLDLDKQRSSSQWIAEVEPGIEVDVADTPEECLLKARRLRRHNEFVVGDGPGGIDDVSRTVLILADLALLPNSPSILDLRSVQQATSICSMPKVSPRQTRRAFDFESHANSRHHQQRAQRSCTNTRSAVCRACTS